MMNIAALLSGGVDSSVVVHLLCEQGYKPTLFYIKIGMDGAEYMDCSAEEDIEMSTAIARKYDLSLEVVDLHKEYWENVAAYAIDKIKKGLTPNPDVMCNKLIKFGCFEQQVGKDFDLTATGHYATTLQLGGKTWLGTAKDPIKDQTDFLAQIDYLQVSKLLFPIGGLMKHEVREIALQAGLPSARRKDSQGICFLGKINYNDFVRRFLGEKEGAVIEFETGKKIGTHRGYWFHTIGQRKGLGLSLDEISGQYHEQYGYRSSKIVYRDRNGNVYRYGDPRYRPSYGSNQVMTVWNNAKTEGGVVIDNETIIEWDENSSRVGVWDISGQEYIEAYDRYMLQEYDPNDFARNEALFVEEYRNAENYHPQIPHNNRSDNQMHSTLTEEDFQRLGIERVDELEDRQQVRDQPCK